VQIRLIIEDKRTLGEEKKMNAEYLVSAVIAVLLLVYLVYALLKPERF
jgi:K+-transporting ATPase KdpF subunit